jgi:predicted DNA-binding transcriptional regulator YafY
MNELKIAAREEEATARRGARSGRVGTKECARRDVRQVYSRAPLARVYRIHQLVQSGTFPNCSTIARELEVATKTVVRDIELMRNQLGWPVEYDSTRHGYFYSGPVDGFPNLPMSEAELFSLLIAREALAQYKGTPFQAPIEAALRKLCGALGASSSAPTEASNVVAFHSVGADTADETTFRLLTEAARQHRLVRFSHRKAGAAERLRREVQPYCVLCIENHWYLVGFDVGRKAIRKFALPRIRDLAVTDERFIMPHHFDPAAYLRTSFGAFKGEDDYEIVIEFDAWAADLIRGRQWHVSQAITELSDGKILFRMRLDSLEEVERWVLSWGTHATVLKPAALCNRVHEIVVELAERYLTQLKEEAKRPVPPYEPRYRN